MATLVGDAATMQGKYVVLDTTVGSTSSVIVPQLSGHQGDAGRIIYLAVKDGTTPHNMDGQKLVLKAKDATGTPKVSDTMTAVDSSAGGLVQFTVPAQFYQADGPYSTAYFELRSTTTDTVISTINVSFEVLESATIMTTGQSEVYNNAMSNAMESVNASINNQLQVLQDQVSNAAALAKTAQSSLDALTAAAKANSFAALAGNNEFTGNNNFDGTTTIKNLSSPTIDNLKSTLTNNINAVSGSVSNQLSGKLNVEDAWTRNYTLGGALTAPQGGTNQFALSRYKIMDGLSIITGRGDLVVNSANEYYEGTITLPWVVDNADTAFVQVYWNDANTASSYAVPRLGTMSRDLAIAMKGARTNHTIRLSLVIITRDY
ncbi:phage baseplate upper protein [Limosilactobacillus fermentum]|uniref:phage baseplate upper protein n=1 Tax=Limosilactobacillus fermentum TaxID=1613 RepID=UPI0021F16873|nr:phage baseplate upper protein [Limosilactobacillus fermentum]